MLNNCKYSHIFLLKRKIIFPVEVRLSLSCQTLFFATIIPLTSKGKFVDYVNYYVLLFSELQHMLAHGGLHWLTLMTQFGA